MKTYEEMVIIAAWLGNQSLYGGSGNIMSSAHEMKFTVSIVYDIPVTQFMTDVANYISAHKSELDTMPKPVIWSY